VERSHQEGRGRPSEKTRYIREVITRFDVKCEIDHAALAAEHQGDGVFPLITNDRALSEREMLLAYKGQPVIEINHPHYVRNNTLYQLEQSSYGWGFGVTGAGTVVPQAA
jgi:hypothetical protein